MQELMWVKRDENGVIVRMSEKPPQTGDFIPTVPKKVQQKTERKKEK